MRINFSIKNFSIRLKFVCWKGEIWTKEEKKWEYEKWNNFCLLLLLLHILDRDFEINVEVCLNYYQNEKKKKKLS